MLSTSVGKKGSCPLAKVGAHFGGQFDGQRERSRIGIFCNINQLMQPTSDVGTQWATEP
jgi:hypothetical protein